MSNTDDIESKIGTLLLTNMSLIEIAGKLGMHKVVTRKYAMRIYRRNNVKNRYEYMSTYIPAVYKIVDMDVKLGD